MQFAWNINSVILYEMRGLSEDPNQTDSYTSNPHLASIIYAQNSRSNDNFPVRGYIVGGAASIWSYNACQTDEFDLTGYDQLFTTPGENQRVGVLQKLELDKKSCNIEQVTIKTYLTTEQGVGRVNEGESLQPLNNNENMDLFTASDYIHEINVSLGDWETFLGPYFD